MKILDLWCGFWNNIYNIYSSENEVVGVDIEETNINACKEKFPEHTFLRIDWDVLPFWDETFDVIQSLDVLEHVDDLNAVLIEAKRVLKKCLSPLDILSPFLAPSQPFLCKKYIKTIWPNNFLAKLAVSTLFWPANAWNAKSFFK